MTEELKIFPCRDKRPCTPNGLYDALPESEWDLEAYEQWGAPCGAVNGFFVVDVDKQHGGLEEAAKHDWGTTLKVDTPSGGFHLYYKYDEETCGGIRNGVSVLPGIDVRSNGGYVILYGQVELSAAVPAPAWLIELLKQPAKKLADFSSYGEVGEGGRNHYLAAAAGRMQKIGVLSLAALQEINEAKCSPPLADEEVASIFASISRYAPESTPAEDEAPEIPYQKASDLMSDFLSYIRDDNQKFGEPTGIEGLDELLGGGIRPGELIGVLAQGKSGKSALTHKIIHNWLKAGKGVGYASRELRPATEVMPNLFSLELQKNALKSALKDEEVSGPLSKWELYFSRGFGYMPLEEIRSWVVALKNQGTTRFVFDHLHHFCGDEDYKVIAGFSRAIKQLMLDEHVAGILVIQPKQLLPDQKISFNSIRGGSAVAQAIDALVTLERQRDENNKLTNVTQVRLDIARHKLAKLGEIYLQYDNDTMDYVEVEPQEEEEAQPTPETIQLYGRTPSPAYVPPVEQVRTEPVKLAAPDYTNPFNAAKLAGSMAKRITSKRLE